MLSDAFIRSAPEGTHWDDKLRGFGIRVGKRRKTFLVLVASGRRHSIGVYPLLSLQDARNTAKQLLAAKTLGYAQKPRTAHCDASQSFLEDCSARLRPKTLENYRHQLRKHFPFGTQAVGSITTRQIVAILNTLTPSQKEHAIRAGKTYFRWCVRHGIIDKSPMELMQAHIPQPRQRVLTEAELAEVYRTAMQGTDNFSRLVSFLILTGQRRGESSRIRPEWINDDTLTFPSEVTKNKRQHSIPLTPHARVRAEAPTAYVFGGSHPLSDWTKLKRRFDDRHTVRDYTLHSLRRTFATYHAQLGTPQVVVERILNHVSGGVLSPIASAYNRYSYMDEMRSALLNWEGWLTRLTIAQGLV